MFRLRCKRKLNSSARGSAPSDHLAEAQQRIRRDEYWEDVLAMHPRFYASKTRPVDTSAHREKQAFET